jgi:hypothetical protein
VSRCTGRRVATSIVGWNGATRGPPTAARGRDRARALGSRAANALPAAMD